MDICGPVGEGQKKCLLFYICGSGRNGRKENILNDTYEFYFQQRFSSSEPFAKASPFFLPIITGLSVLS